jgi:hypothetical protein
MLSVALLICFVWRGSGDINFRSFREKNKHENMLL